MADNKRSSFLGQPLDILQIRREAQHRWLRPAEICKILSNHKHFHTASEPPNMPPSGSLFLFDRKVLRYFRKDGHNWSKKRDGKTVKEAHEKLKSGSIDVLHCYYAHGEDNKNFQRRTYWMLEEELTHIVLVHYLEVKDSRSNVNRQKMLREALEEDTAVSSNFASCQMSAHIRETTSMNKNWASEYGDIESAQDNKASFKFHSFLEVQQPAVDKLDASSSGAYVPELFPSSLPTFHKMDLTSIFQPNKARESGAAGLKHFDFPLWEDVLDNFPSGIQSIPSQTLTSSHFNTRGQSIAKELDGTMGQLLATGFGRSKETGFNKSNTNKWQNSERVSSSAGNMDQDVPPDLTCELASRFHDGEPGHDLELFHARENHPLVQGDLLKQHPGAEQSRTVHQNTANVSGGKQFLLDSSTDEGLKKLDSFNRWMTKELGDVNEIQVHSASGIQWDTIDGESGFVDSGSTSDAQLDSCMLGPSLSQDQLFSIVDFSPNCANVGSEVKVLVVGRFLKSQQEVENCRWSCMFGEVEVPAEIIAEGVLRCHAPLHKAGRVPFYVTCSNRVACSQIYEFEYQVSGIQDVEMAGKSTSSISENLRMRFGKLLCESSCPSSKFGTNNFWEVAEKINNIHSLLKEDDWDQMVTCTSEEGLSLELAKERFLQKLLKVNLRVWLSQKAAESGKGPSVLDDNGQGVLHLAAALGYDWAFEPALVSGLNVNFRDVNGWTALHWAAFCGRERTVVSLIHLGAAPGVITDPTPRHPKGRTPADLASAEGHKGIAAYLAEYALSAHLVSLNLDKKEDVAETYGAKLARFVSNFNEHSEIENIPCGIPLKDPLDAVRNATQAAARIYQVFRVESFQRKQLKEFGDDKIGMSDERALSLIELRREKSGGHQNEPVHAAAVRIQNKFRGWKGRREYLITRQRILKIQAHVRGYQVRKNYRKIVWSVGILEKVILRWKRKRSGLRGFKPEALMDGPSGQNAIQREDDDDFFREGRKQTEERSQVALARVKSMLRYPEARDQYQRLQNATAEMLETKVVNKGTSKCEVTAGFDYLIDVEQLLGDNTFTAKTS